MLDFVAEHPWACLLLLIALCVSIEFIVNRDDWKKRSAELTVTFVGIFAAVIFALVQSKYDRDQEGKDKAIAFFKATEIEISAIMSENKIELIADEAWPGDKIDKLSSYLGENRSSISREEVSVIVKSLVDLASRIAKTDASASDKKIPIFSALVKEPEVLSMFSNNAMHLLYSEYKQIISYLEALIHLKEVDNYFTSFLVNIPQNKPGNESKFLLNNSSEYQAYKKFYESFYKGLEIRCLSYSQERKRDGNHKACMVYYQVYIGRHYSNLIWKYFMDTQYVLCSLRSSVEFGKDFTYGDDGIWVEMLKSSCGKAEGLLSMKPGDLPYVEALVNALKHGPR